MVLNHASLSSGGSREAVRWLSGMARGMAALLREGLAEPALRTARAPTELRSPEGWSLFDGYQGLRQAGLRDEQAFFLRLTARTPLLAEVSEDVKNRFLACEAHDCDTRALTSEDGKPLVLCAVSHGIAISFPSEPVWRRNRFTVRFHELLPNEELAEAEEEVDNLAQVEDSGPILARHRKALSRRCSSGIELWSHRQALYPHLMFGPDVEAQVERMDAGLLSVVMNRLAQLNEAAGRWEAGPAPSWPCKVTPESEKTMAKRRLRQARVFRSTRGTHEVFEWHARFGASGRIHLRFAAVERTVEIGYIGMHLPL